VSVKKGMRAGGLAIVHRRTQARGSHHIHQYAEDVRASILPKLGAYPPQKQLAAALREVGRLDRTLFTLDHLRDIIPFPHESLSSPQSSFGGGRRAKQSTNARRGAGICRRLG
jgi:hypothetical protein